MKRLLAWTGIGVVGLSVLLGGCGSGGASRLNGAGSSFVKPMMDEWAKLYRKEKNIEVNYQSKGSSTGKEQMTNKEIDFGCSDAPMSDDELKTAEGKGGKVVHIPLVMGAVVPVYNLKGIDKPLQFSGSVLADIFRRQITKWNDEALKKLNPGVMLPDQDIKVVHRADGSGTNYVFTEFLSKVSPTWKKEIKFGTSVNWPEGTFGERGNEGVSKYVQYTPGAIGYVELLYALQIKMPYGSVLNAEGKFIHADLKSITAAAQAKVKDIPPDLRFSLTDAPGEDSYPICGTVWAICYVKQPADKAGVLKGFLTWVTHEGQNQAAALDYARLPQELIPRLEAKLNEISTGS
jgi:phosphate transport system substrate-binding protein